MNLAETERTSGEHHYLKVLNLAHEILKPRFYLEIGVRHGDSLRLSTCPSIGIDPLPNLRYDLGAHAEIKVCTSDSYFASDAVSTLPTIDLAFIDGMHLSEFALRDFINIEKYCANNSLIVFDDIFPNHPLQANRVRKTGVWTGDVWKIVPCLKSYRPSLVCFAINTSPTGLLIVTNLDRSSRVLEENYDNIRSYLESDEDPPSEVLGREGAISSGDPRVSSFLSLLARRRAPGSSGAEFNRELDEWRSTAFPSRQ